MNLAALAPDLGYLLWGTFPDGPPGGALLTLLISAASAVASAVLGLVWGVLLVMSSRGWQRVLELVLGFLRAIPVLMLVFWIYFLLPVVLGVDVPGVLSVMCALALVSGAYLAHGVAAGIRGVATGQWHAGMAMGMSRWQTLRHIVLPQAMTMMMPSFVNQWVTLVKDSSLAYIVGVGELSFLATQVNAQLMVYPAQVFLVVGLIYWVLCSALDRLASTVVQRVDRSRTERTQTTGGPESTAQAPA